MSGLILDESEVLLDVVQPCPVSMPEHVRMQLADASLFANTLDLGINRAVSHPPSLLTDQ